MENNIIYFSDRYDAMEGVTYLESGNDRHVQTALDFMKELNENVEVLHTRWAPSVEGAFPDVPSYLANDPLSMWRSERTTSDTSPLRVWVGVSSSAGISERALVKRGCVLAAFAIALSEKRPVLITPFKTLGWFDRKTWSILSWDVTTGPLILADLMASVAEPLAFRHAGIMAGQLHNPSTSPYCPPVLTQPSTMRNLLGAQPQDLYLEAIDLRDPMLSDPIGWLKEHIARYGSEEETA